MNCNTRVCNHNRKCVAITCSFFFPWLRIHGLRSHFLTKHWSCSSTENLLLRRLIRRRKKQQRKGTQQYPRITQSFVFESHYRFFWSITQIYIPAQVRNLVSRLYWPCSSKYFVTCGQTGSHLARSLLRQRPSGCLCSVWSGYRQQVW